MRTSTTIYLSGLKPLIVSEGRKISYVAEKVGVDASFLSQLAGCKRGASLAMALRLAEFFGVTVEKLVRSAVKSLP